MGDLKEVDWSAWEVYADEVRRKEHSIPDDPLFYDHVRLVLKIAQDLYVFYRRADAPVTLWAYTTPTEAEYYLPVALFGATEQVEWYLSKVTDIPVQERVDITADSPYEAVKEFVRYKGG
jgi:hypothetical protein